MSFSVYTDRFLFTLKFIELKKFDLKLVEIKNFFYKFHCFIVNLRKCALVCINLRINLKTVEMKILKKTRVSLSDKEKSLENEEDFIFCTWFIIIVFHKTEYF